MDGGSAGEALSYKSLPSCFFFSFLLVLLFLWHGMPGCGVAGVAWRGDDTRDADTLSLING